MRSIVGLAVLFSMSVASAQVYKWTDSRGVVHYSDTPVTPNAVAVGKPPPPPPTLALPYALVVAARQHPVTLYTASGCTACDQGRSLLKQRGIPFVEKTVTSDADVAKLKEAGGGTDLPLLLVGRSKQVGFEAGSWHGALDAAAYPRRSMLPKSYRYQSASAADPVPMPLPVAADAPQAEPRRNAPVARPEGSELPPGFQF